MTTQKRPFMSADGKTELPVMSDKDFFAMMAEERRLKELGYMHKDDIQTKVTLILAGIAVFGGVVLLCALLRTVAPIHWWRRCYGF